MKQSTSSSTIFHNVKRIFYALQVICLTVAVPTLAAIGMSHHDVKAENKIESRVSLSGGQKDMSYNFDLPTTTFTSK